VAVRRVCTVLAVIGALMAYSVAATAAPTRTSAGVGDTITLHGLEDGETLAVTLTKVVDAATPADDMSGPASGNRLVATQFRLANVGSVEFTDAIDNDVQVIDAQGQGYQTTLDDVTAGPSFPEVRISPGESRLGYVVFEVPRDVRLAEVQFVPDSGVASDTGEWRMPPRAGSPSTGEAPEQVVRAYFDAINAGDYQRAWDLGGRNLGGSYRSFAAGFQATSHDTVTINSTHGSVVAVDLDAEQTDGSHRDFSGTYTVHHGVITGAHMTRD
jgi:hypothetical protein